MMKMTCKKYTGRIVDYVDGELPEDETQRMAQHLTGCERCRRTAQALERSLGLARVIWSANLGDSESPAQSEPARRSRRIRFYAIAAGTLVAASVLMVTMPKRPQEHVPVPFEEVEQQIARAGAAAELLAATQILARCEGTEAVVERQYQFILQEYAGTPAAEAIRAQHGLHSGGIQ